jgi:hypothetical protein
LQNTYANRRCKTFSWIVMQPLSGHSNTRSASAFPQPETAPSPASSLSAPVARLYAPIPYLLAERDSTPVVQVL